MEYNNSEEPDFSEDETWQVWGSDKERERTWERK